MLEKNGCLPCNTVVILGTATKCFTFNLFVKQFYCTRTKKNF